MVKLRHSIRWSLPSETWRSLEIASTGAVMALCAMGSIGALALWINLWGRAHDPGRLFLYASLGALFVTCAVLAWLLFVAFLYGLLTPKGNAPTRPPRMPPGWSGRTP